MPEYNAVLNAEIEWRLMAGGQGHMGTPPGALRCRGVPLPRGEFLKRSPPSHRKYKKALPTRQGNLKGIGKNPKMLKNGQKSEMKCGN